MKHEPKIFLVDIDQTLTNEVCFTPEECLNATPNKEWIDWTNKHFATDFIILYTARRRDLYLATMEWLDKNCVQFHAYKDSKTPGVIVDADSINEV